jgi:hypothetical protein
MIVGIALVACTPLLGLAAGAIDDAWVPVADNALIAISTADVGSHTPTFGVSSRFGYHHPGPALFLSLAPTYQLFGVKGLPVGAALVASASLAVTTWLLWRRGGAVLGLGGGVVLALLTRSLAAEVINPWNPWISLLPFALLLVAAWSVLCGDRWSLPITLGIASWLVQVHLGYTVMAGALAIAAVVAAIGYVTRGDRDRRAAWRWPAATAVVVLALMWALPVIGELTEDPGNLELIVESFRDPSEPSAGWTPAFGTTANGVGIASGWLTGTENFNPLVTETLSAPLWQLLVPFVIAIAVAGVAWVRRSRLEPGPERRLITHALLGQAVVWATVVTGIVSVARITGPTFDYLLRWQWVLAAFSWMSAGWTAYVAVVRPRAQTIGEQSAEPAWLRMALGVALVAASATAFVAVASAELPDRSTSDSIRGIVEATAVAVDGNGPVLVDFDGSAFGEYQAALVAALEERGFEVWVPDAREVAFGTRRTPRGRDPGMEIVVVAGDAIDERTAAGQEPIAEHEPLTVEERAELNSYRARIREQFEQVDAGREPIALLTDGELARVRELNARGDRVAVFRGSR